MRRDTSKLETSYINEIQKKLYDAHPCFLCYEIIIKLINNVK